MDKLRELNREKLKRLNLPRQIGQQKIFILDIYTPYKFDGIPIVIVKGSSKHGIHANSVVQVIEQVYPSAEFYFGSSLTDAVEYCIEHHIRIINASISAPYTRNQNDALKKYYDWGGIFVAAAGNEEGKRVSFPASSPYTIGVSATNVPDCDGPEIDVTSDSAWWVYNASTGLKYPFCGTSCATPVITACVAYILDYYPNWQCEDVRQFLRTNSLPLTEEYERFFSFPKGFGEGAVTTFETITVDELLKRLDTYNHNELHVHHTWSPSHKDFNGSNGIQLQEAMKKYHVETNGWSDIGQHVTLLPDGLFITGRDFGKAPASIAGFNTGAFACEMLGNFDIGHDVFGGKQKESMLKLAAYFNNKGRYVRFHRENASKTCPGSSIDKNTFMQEVMSMGSIFKDIDDNRWSAAYIKAAKELGLVVGNPDGTFNPEGPLTREQAAVILVRLYEKITGRKVV